MATIKVAVVEAGAMRHVVVAERSAAGVTRVAHMAAGVAGAAATVGEGLGSEADRQDRDRGEGETNLVHGLISFKGLQLFLSRVFVVYTRTNGKPEPDRTRNAKNLSPRMARIERIRKWREEKPSCGTVS
jgi:hypothetical protein